MNTQKLAPFVPVNIPTPRAVPAEACPSCGYDPCILWDANGQFPIGRNEALGIDKPGYLCMGCCESNALFRAPFMATVWAR